jgi:uncharacterized protein (DUF3820 family)
MGVLTDEDLMPWGKYEGVPMEDVPAQYLLWCYHNDKISDEVKEYVEENMDALEKEL